MNHIVCLGYAKCGTTMLDAVFRGSGLVATPVARKEIKFFLPPQYPGSDAYARYLEQFFPDGRQGRYTHTFEASPPYCHQDRVGFSAVIDRVRNTLPGANVVICVRNPIVRAYSHYIHNLHSFALYGDGVFSARPELPRKIYRKSFEESLKTGNRLVTSYAEYLTIAKEAFGSRLKLFFLEHDVARFREWVCELAGEEVAAELGLSKDPPAAVIPRRPVPNYSIEGGRLLAFGSRGGEFIAYEGLPLGVMRSIRDSRKTWTLSLEKDEMRRLLDQYFAKDLRESAQVTGDGRFLEYIDRVPEPQSAALASPKLLSTLHGKAMRQTPTEGAEDER